MSENKFPLGGAGGNFHQNAKTYSVPSKGICLLAANSPIVELDSKIHPYSTNHNPWPLAPRRDHRAQSVFLGATMVGIINEL